MSQQYSHTPHRVTILLQPEGKELLLDRPKTVLQLLNKLGVRPGAVLVIREGSLLTPDQPVLPGDRITVRVVTSSG